MMGGQPIRLATSAGIHLFVTKYPAMAQGELALVVDLARKKVEDSGCIAGAHIVRAALMTLITRLFRLKSGNSCGLVQGCHIGMFLTNTMLSAWCLGTQRRHLWNDEGQRPMAIFVPCVGETMGGLCLY